MKERNMLRKVFGIKSAIIFFLLLISLLSLSYGAASIIYGESHEQVKLPAFLGNKTENIDLLGKSNTGDSPFSFFVVGDTQLGDFFPGIYKNDIKSDSPNFGLILGDFVKNPKAEDHAQFMMDFPTWGVNVPVFLVCGNHEIVTKTDIANNRWFSFTLKDFEKTYGPADFSFYYHGCLFVILNDVDTDSHVAYLADALSHRKKDTLMTFVFTHIPAHTISPAISSKEMLGEKEFLSLVENNNVDYVIEGDFHSYFRAKVRNTIFLISGGGTDKFANKPKNEKEGSYQAMLIQVDPVTRNVNERIYIGKSEKRPVYTMKKIMLTQVFAFFEHDEKWETPIMGSGGLASCLLGIWFFSSVRAHSRKQERTTRDDFTPLQYKR